MLTIRVAVESNISEADLNTMIAVLGNPAPAASPIARALEQTGLVHFASLSVVDAGPPGRPKSFLLLELNADGPAEAALDTVVPAIEPFVGEIFRRACPKMGSLRTLLGKNLLKLHFWPTGATGLEFEGTGEFSVREIDRQAALAAFAGEAFNHFARQHAGLDGRALGAVEFIRGVIQQDDRLLKRAAGTSPDAMDLKGLLERGRTFADALILAGGDRLKFTQWAAPKPWSALDIIGALVKTKEFKPVAMALFAVWLGLTSIIFGEHLGHGITGVVGRLLVAFGVAFLVELALVSIVATALILAFQAQEALDVSDDETPSLSTIEAVARNENAPGYGQNHFMSVTQLKPGLLRTLSLSAALFGISLLINNRYRPGFVTTMGTIHYARWFRLPKTTKLIFLANYDGSWESYLEDFIMRVHQGQSAAWSNGVGFPRTRNLTEDGAEDGDRFKRWVRRQQRIAPFWYSRFPTFTTDQIRNNALIQHGLARAQNETSARAWLKCFGAMHRPDNTIETEEVQSLVFGSMGDLPYGALAIIELPLTADQRKSWLAGIMPGSGSDISPVCFGDVSENQRSAESAVILAFSASGLGAFGLSPPNKTDGLGTFPGVFNMGMQARSRILGDIEPDTWPWSDRRGHAAMLIYGKNQTVRDGVLARHKKHLEDGCGGRILQVIETGATSQTPRLTKIIDGKPIQDDRQSFEHFRFRDNISQPVIRGTQGSFLGALSRDIVAPGEFIFGYANSRGYFPPSPVVSAASDDQGRLPIRVANTKLGEDGGTASNPPNFDAVDPNDDWRDFGRNGVFVAIRQLVQNVEGFDRYIAEAAERVATTYPHAVRALGGAVTADWIAAKLMGRWRNGTPLVFHPRGGSAPTDPDSRNDFTYGEIDPSGLKCPLGAHIRRANPRDSLHPGDPQEQAVTNRHRILRRGRSYQSTDGEKGLLFMALCGDLERQFELVQQTWIGSPSFHGLHNEPDPIIAPGSAAKKFTIPTTAGPIVLRNIQSFVTVKAGGYFFLPSRSALRYLIDLTPSSPVAAEALASSSAPG